MIQALVRNRVLQIALHTVAVITCGFIAQAINTRAAIIGTFAGIAAVFLGVNVAAFIDEREKKAKSKTPS